MNTKDFLKLTHLDSKEYQMKNISVGCGRVTTIDLLSEATIKEYGENMLVSTFKEIVEFLSTCDDCELLEGIYSLEVRSEFASINGIDWTTPNIKKDDIKIIMSRFEIKNPNLLTRDDVINRDYFSLVRYQTWYILNDVVYIMVLSIPCSVALIDTVDIKMIEDISKHEKQNRYKTLYNNCDEICMDYINFNALCPELEDDNLSHICCFGESANVSSRRDYVFNVYLKKQIATIPYNYVFQPSHGNVASMICMVFTHQAMSPSTQFYSPRISMSEEDFNAFLEHMKNRLGPEKYELFYLDYLANN